MALTPFLQLRRTTGVCCELLLELDGLLLELDEVRNELFEELDELLLTDGAGD